MAAPETARLIASLELKDKLSPSVASASASIDKLGAKTNTLGAVSARAGKGLRTLGSNLKGAVMSPLGLIGITGAAFGLEKVISESVGKAQDFGSEVSRLSALMGISAQATSGYALTLQHFGIGADAAVKLTGMLEKNVGNLTATKKKATAFEQLYGLSLLDANGKVKDGNQLLLDSADYFNNKAIPAQTKAAALAKIYGRSWQQLIPILQSGRKGIGAITTEADKLHLGNLATDIQSNKAAMRDWNTAMDLLQIEIGAKLLPHITDLAKIATQFVSQHGDEIVGFFEDGAKFAGEMGGAIHDYVLPAIGAIQGVWASIPPDLKKILVGGFVVNKLTGGALTGIVSELGKGLIHGVLGLNAGVVNVNAGVVNGAGGIPGGAAAGAGGAAGGTGVLGILGAAGAAAAGAAILGAIQSGAQQVFAGISPSQAATNAFNQASGIPKGQFALLDNLANLPKLLDAVQHGNVLEGGLIDQLTHKDAPAQTKSLGTIVGGSVARAVASAFEKAKQTALSAAIDKDIHRLETLTSRLHQAKESGDSGRTASLREKIARVSERVDSEKQALTSSVVAARDATQRAGVTTSSAATAAGRVVAAAVEANRPYISTIVKVSVSAAGVSRSITVQNRSGPGNGSAGGGSASDRNGTTPNKPGSGARGG